MLNIVNNKKIFFAISLVIIALGVVFYFVNGGLNLDVDYTGGTNLHLDLGQEYEVSEVEDIIKGVVSDAQPHVVKGGEAGTEVMITIKELTDAESTDVLNAIREKYDPMYDATEEAVEPVEEVTEDTEAPAEETVEGEEALVEDAEAAEATEDAADDATEEVEESPFKVYTRDTVSATVGKELGRSAVLSSIIAILLMLVYISFRFEFWSGVAAVISLAQNVLVLVSVYAIFQIPVNSTFIAALLTIVGYSINDTIVIFDRIRENNRFAKKTPFAEVANTSINQSLTRSINTSITTLLSILLLYILGVESIKQFSLPIIIGIVVGTWSSLTIASPLWVMFKGDKKEA